MKERISELLKKYVLIFIDEYAKYLSRDQLEILRNINYNSVISFEDLNIPFGVAEFGKIHLSNANNGLISDLKNMPNYNTTRSLLHNKNLSSYLEYMCVNGYELMDYYEDILMYFVFQFVTKNNSGLTHGLINQEMKYLSIKYSLRLASLYAKEEHIATKITNIIKIDNARKILFMDSSTSFKYLNDKLGFSVANLVFEVSNLIDNEYKVIAEKEYQGVNGILDYANLYDKIMYGDVYNRLLDYEAKSMLAN